jgi:hypothetical protein
LVVNEVYNMYDELHTSLLFVWMICFECFVVCL